MHPRFQPAFATLPLPLQHALKPLLSAADFAGFIRAEQAVALKKQCELNDSELAFALLPLAAACAVAPLSGFSVGAIARGESGTLWFGANMEFVGATMQQTVHAEQSAVTHAWLRGENALAGITVNYTPCGHCRQFMNELNSGSGLTIELPGRAAATLGHYLPDSFGPRDLAITTLLMDDVDHGIAPGAMRCNRPRCLPPTAVMRLTPGHGAALRCKPAPEPSLPVAMQKMPPLTPACRRCKAR